MFQSVSFVLMLLMLAPLAFAAMQCGATSSEKQNCSKPCCAGMGGMSMPMDRNAIDSGSRAQLSQAPCCTVSETDATLLAPPAISSKVDLVPFAAPSTIVLPVDFQIGHSTAAEFPPGNALREPVLSRLCTFLI